MRKAFPILFTALALAPVLTPDRAWADSAAERPGLQGIRLGMTFEDAQSVLNARDMTPAKGAAKGFNDRFRGLRAKAHFADAGGQGAPFAVTFPFRFKPAGALEVTFVTAQEDWFVSAVTTRQTFDRRHPEAFETIQNLKEDFGFRKSSCTSRGRFGFHSNVWNRKVVKMRTTKACLSGLNYDKLSDWTPFFDEVGGAYNMDHGVTLRLTNTGSAPHGHVDKVEIRLMDYARTVDAVEDKVGTLEGPSS